MPLSTYLPEHMGSATLTPSGPFIAGSHAELILVYTAGTFGIDDSGMLKISWRTTSDMAKPQFTDPSAPNLHDGRGKQRRKAGLLDRSAQHSALGQYTPHSRRAWLPACGRYPDHPPGRSPTRLAGSAPADKLRGAFRAQNLRRCLCDLRIRRNPKLAGLRARCRSGSALESDTALTGGASGSRSVWRSLPRTYGAIRPMWIVRSVSHRRGQFRVFTGSACTRFARGSSGCRRPYDLRAGRC